MLAGTPLALATGMEQRDDRLPLPSEDEGDLVDEPASGMTNDHLVAQEEGVPYDPPSDRVLTARTGDGGADRAGTDPTDAGELEREDMVQPDDGQPPRDEELQADVVERLRASDVPAGDRLQIAAVGSRVILRGQVESVDVLDEILGIVGEVPGVEDVTDEVEIAGV
jgi:hypothetical protein